METNQYLKHKEEIQKEINNFPCFFAFDKKQLEEGLKKLNVTKKDVLSIGGGGFIRKSDKESYINMLKRQSQKEDELLKDENFLFKAFKYELSNNEFCITQEYEETLNVFGLTYENLTETQKSILKNARDKYLEEVE